MENVIYVSHLRKAMKTIRINEIFQIKINKMKLIIESAFESTKNADT